MCSSDLTEGLHELEPAEQHRIAKSLATNIGMMLVTDPVMASGETLDTTSEIYQDGYNRGFRAGMERALEINLALVKKWGNPDGTEIEQGAQDQGHRVDAAIRAAAKIEEPK